MEITFDAETRKFRVLAQKQMSISCTRCIFVVKKHYNTIWFELKTAYSKLSKVFQNQ